MTNFNFWPFNILVKSQTKPSMCGEFSLKHSWFNACGWEKLTRHEKQMLLGTKWIFFSSQTEWNGTRNWKLLIISGRCPILIGCQLNASINQIFAWSMEDLTIQNSGDNIKPQKEIQNLDIKGSKIGNFFKIF